MKSIRGQTRSMWQIDDLGFFPRDHKPGDPIPVVLSPYGPLDFDAFEKNRQAMANDLGSELEPINFGNTRVVEELVQGQDFWKMEIVHGRDWKMEKKLRCIGINPSVIHWDIPTGRSRKAMRAANKRKRQARARTGRK